MMNAFGGEDGENKLSMILKGSLSNGTATKYSDIDLIILGEIEAGKLDGIINNNEIVRKPIASPVIFNKPLYYKILRLVHRATIKYLSNKKESTFLIKFLIDLMLIRI